MNAILIAMTGLTGLITLVVGWLGWQVLRQNGRILLRLDELEKRLNELEFGGAEGPEGLQVGTEAPAFELPDLAGGSRTLAEFRGQPLLLVFFNPACGFCRELAPKLKDKAENRKQKAEMEPPQQPHLLIVTTGDAETNRQFFAEQGVGCPVLLQNDGEVAKAYRANGTPTGYLVSAEGKIASELAIGAEALLKLAEEGASDGKQKTERDESLTSASTMGADGSANRFREHSLARSKIKRDGLKAGTPAPDFRLPRLDGRGELTLSGLRGRRVLLVFSSPGCGPCLALAPQLERFHRKHPELEVVMIGKGEAKENRARVKEHGLTFPVVLQQRWEISRRYAIFATPVAYLIDKQGVITRDVAVGTDAILDLAAWAEERLAHAEEAAAA